MRGDRACRRCGESPLRRPTRVCGWCVDELEREAIKALTQPSPYRSFGIFALRDQGYSPEQVGEAKCALAEGASVDEALRRMREFKALAVAA